MTDAQNERTRSGNRRRSRRSQRGKTDRPPAGGHGPAHDTTPDAFLDAAPVESTSSPVVETVEFVRPDDAAAPTDRIDVYCVHHMVLLPEQEPFNFRTNMTTLRHLAVDRFGEATLFCDCLHNGPHEWPPSLQRLETAIELDQFLTDSTREA